MNIYEKMSAVTSELTAVAKNLSVGVGKGSYKAVGEADVLAAVKPLEIKHKIYSFPVDRKIINEQIMVTDGYNGSKKSQQFVRVETTYRFVNTEKPDEYLDIKSYGDGVDSQDKAPGKAMTYSDKYALLKAYKIITGDDPDQFKSEEGQFFSSDLATDIERKTLYEVCEKQGVDYLTLLKSVGCNDKKKLTKAQHAKALLIVKDSTNGSNRPS